jgi:chromosome partitioning protein
MKTLPFANNKGGVGKTTSVQNVGACLADKGYRILLIDTDSQGSLTRAYGINPNELQFNSGDLMLGNASFEQVVLKSDRVHIIPSNKLNKDYENMLAGKNMYHTKLKKALQFARGHYDFCLIDCPPALSAFTTNALYAADYYFVPLQAGYLSYEGLANLLEFTQEIEEEGHCELGGVFTTRYNPKIRITLRQEIVSKVSDQLKEYFFSDCFIRENVHLDEAQAQGKDIFEYKPESNGAKDYLQLTETILNRLGMSSNTLTQAG